VQGGPALGFTDAALEALGRHRWPGNVRELRNVVERAFLTARGRRIDLPDLPAELRRPADAPPASPDPAGLTLADVERAHIEKVLGLAGWNRSLAARLLDIDRRTLFSKIQRYGLIGPLRPGPGPDGDCDDAEPGER
jgi:transcriptional regulator of acetoin/glycerol metabolism